MIGRLAGIVIDCPEPRALAQFYEALLGAERVEDSAEWVTLAVDVSHARDACGLLRRRGFGRKETRVCRAAAAPPSQPR